MAAPKKSGETAENERSVRLSAFMFTTEVKNFAALLSVQLNEVEALELDSKFGLDGIIYVKKKPKDMKRPPWAIYLDTLHGKIVEGLETASSSAVMFIRVEEKIIAFSFGYGRYLLNEVNLTPDFGIKTALNTLNHDTLRTLDIFSLEQEPIQKRSQAIKSANINAFGVDVSRDVLRAVTGDPIKEISWSSISGGGAQYTFTAKLNTYADLAEIGAQLQEKYQLMDYQSNFGWVDNIQRIKNNQTIEKLNAILLSHVTSGDVETIKLSLPGASDWTDIFGFSYTNGRVDIKPSPDIVDYYAVNDFPSLTIQKLKDHRLYCLKMSGEDAIFSIYDCIYFECEFDGKLHILFSNDWFTIDQDYHARVRAALDLVPLSDLKFPRVKLVAVAKKAKVAEAVAPSKGSGRKKVAKEKSFTLEPEGEYNFRIASELSYHLLDKMLVTSHASASPIEVCDLLTNEGQFIHAKHRKGYSSGLSHLFAQGRVAAELLSSDQEFRKNARKLLRGDAKKLIPELRFDPRGCKIVFLILGADR